MAKHDKTHFNQYSPQTNAKHQILKSYLPAYLNALKNRVKKFHYIDGFAGRGLYENQYIGSPLIAMEEILKAGVANRTSVSFIEEHKGFADELESTIQSHVNKDDFYDDPYIKHGEFHDHINKLLNKTIYKHSTSVATFSFIDPCGLEGVKITDISKLLDLSFGEVLLFFNYDAVTRLLGSVLSETSDSRILLDWYGDRDLLEELLKEWGFSRNSKDRETLIREYYIKALRKVSGAKYFLPFRFDAKDASRTSHYLVHCCNHCLGFKIMKQVMTKTGQQDDGDPYGKLEFLKKEDQVMFDFRIDIDEQKIKILDRLKESDCKVSLFTKDWVCKPNDYFSDSTYKEMLKKLENDGLIFVHDKNNNLPMPSNKRRIIKGKISLGDDYWLRCKTE